MFDESQEMEEKRRGRKLQRANERVTITLSPKTSIIEPKGKKKMNGRSFILSALIAGAAIGIVANLPLFNLINCFLCIFVWAGGALAVVLYRAFQKGGPGLTGGQGAGLGAISGLIGAFVGIFVNALTNAISAPMLESFVRMLNIEGDLPFRSGDLGAIVASTFFFFMFDAITYPIFGALAGWITAVLMKKQS
jgi:hypothetical protein